jgi:hypothetical protein
VLGFGDGFAMALLISIEILFDVFETCCEARAFRLLKRGPNSTKLFLSRSLKLAI